MTALQRAVAVAQVNGIALTVRQYLHFHVTRIGQELFQIDHRVAEGSARFNLGQLDRLDQLGLFMHDAHAATATATGGLDDHRVADALGNLQALGFVFRQWAIGAGHGWYAGFLHGGNRGDLVAHQADHAGARADEGESGVFHLLGKVCTLGEEAVAGVDTVSAGDLCSADDRRNIQVGVGRRCRADADGFVCHGQVHQLAVGSGVHCHGFQTEFLARADHAQGNFTSVGN